MVKRAAKHEAGFWTRRAALTGATGVAMAGAIGLWGAPRLAGAQARGQDGADSTLKTLAALKILGEFQSDGRPVRLHGVLGKGPGPRPAVVLLYGSNALAPDRPYGRIAAALAERGVSTFIPDFFDGVDGASLAEKSKAAHFPRRQQIILDGLGFIRSLPYVAASRVAVFGFSLGAFHASAIASQDRAIKALVVVAGGLPRHLENAELSWLPPTLVLHGAADKIVAPSRAQKLAATATRVGADHRLVIYPGEGHDFRPRIRGESADLVVEFLLAQLGQ
jgi:carboxymethylenebutenolidase